MARRMLLANLGGFFAIALTLVPAPMAMAQITAVNKKPVLITADSLRSDRNRNEVVASGNVRITQGSRTVRADKVIYDQRARRITALGNVVIIEPGGEAIFGERMELTEDLHDGLIERFRLLFPDKTRVAANGARRTGGRRTEMAQVVFSPCKLCAADPASPPLWRIKARRVIHDQNTRDIEYRNAWLELYGVPVVYTPYMAHPDPAVYSRSGFLSPRVGGDRRSGVWIKTPYYWRISRDRDATVTPMITTRDRPGISVEYRQRFKNGAAVVDGSYVNTRRRDFQAQRIIDDGSRGHLSGKVRHDIGKHWRFGADGLWATDNTYLQRYKITNDQTLQSEARLEGFHGRDHTLLSMHHFQGLRADDRYRETPQALPYVEHEGFGRPYKHWGRWHFHFSSASLTRWEGTDSYRASTQLGWSLPYVHKSTGMKFLASVDLFADGYHVTEVGHHSAPRYTGFAGRLYPVARLGWRYPFVRELGNVRVIVKPRAALIASTSGLNSSKIPNEDSTGFEFDDINLFSIDRYPGKDRVDDGTRIVYGVNTIFLGNRGGQSEIFVGQSFQFAGGETFGSGSGLDRRLSDIVGQIKINPGRHFNLVYKFRVDAKDREIPRTEVTTFAGVPALNTSLSYLLFRSNTNSSEFPLREEIAFVVRSQVTRTWSIFGGSRHNLASDGGILKWQAGGQFKNECCTLRATISRSFTYDREIRPSTNFLVLLTLKHLGSFGY